MPNSGLLVPLHTANVVLATSPLLVAAVVVAGLGVSVVIGLSLAALVRRQSRPYLLVTLALITLLARTIVAALSLNGSLDPGAHHVTEHALDVAMVALVVAAVYTAREARGGQVA